MSIDRMVRGLCHEIKNVTTKQKTTVKKNLHLLSLRMATLPFPVSTSMTYEILKICNTTNYIWENITTTTICIQYIIKTIIEQSTQ